MALMKCALENSAMGQASGKVHPLCVCGGH